MAEWVASVSGVASALRESTDAHAFAGRFGTPRASERVPNGFRVDLSDPFVAALEIRPWSGAVAGLVDVLRRDDVEAPPVSEAEGWLGPLEDAPLFDSAVRRVSAVVPGTNGEAGILALFRLDADRIVAIALRRDA
jgi:hypothetical protein